MRTALPRHDGGPCHCFTLQPVPGSSGLVAAASRLWFAAGWFRLAAAAMTTVRHLVLPSVQAGQQAMPRTAARIRLTAGRLWCTASRFWCANRGGFAAGWLGCTAGRFSATTAMATVTAEQIERLGARGAGEQQQASSQDQSLTFHGDELLNEKHSGDTSGQCASHSDRQSPI